MLNKYDKRGAEDALRDIRKQWKRNHVQFAIADDDIPVYPTIASQFNDPGVSWMFWQLCQRLAAKLNLDAGKWTPKLDVSEREPRAMAIIPAGRIRYLSEISEHGRETNASIRTQAAAASQLQHLYEALKTLQDPQLPDRFAAKTSS